jgi:phosphoenolpyruvate carboxykinase (GTP)
VIAWIARRLEGSIGATMAPIGRLPRQEDLELEGLDVSEADLDALFAVDRESWLVECDLTEEFFAQFEGRIPAALNAELAALRYHLTH